MASCIIKRKILQELRRMRRLMTPAEVGVGVEEGGAKTGRVNESRLSSSSYSERNKYVYSLETFVIQIKYKRHYSFSSNEPPLIFSQRLAGRGT